MGFRHGAIGEHGKRSCGPGGSTLRCRIGVAGLLGASFALVFQAVLRFTVGAPLAPEEMAQHLFAWVPMGLFTFFVQLLGGLAKWLAFTGCVGLYLLLGIFAAPWVRRSGPGGAALWAMTGAGFQVLLLAGRYPWAAASGVYLVSSLAYVLAVRGFPGGGRAVTRPTAGPEPDGADPGRRRLLGAAGAVVVGVGAASFLPVVEALARTAARLAAAVTDRLDGLQGMAPWITPNREFYRVSKNLFDPRLNPAEWRLRVDGNVENPLELRYPDLAALEGRVEQYTTLSCISNPVGGDLIGNARWQGVPLRRLLERARLRPGVEDLRFEAADGYTESIPLEKALHPETLLAWEMNGEPLPWDHGGPARLIVPGIYGMKHVKWITRIEAVGHDYLGYWEVRGWSDTAVVRTLSRIDVPRQDQTVGLEPVYVAGIAFAGDRGISRVEVSFDDGATWQEAELEPAPSSLTWVRWLIEWRPPGSGRYTLAVRAYDGRGEMQEVRPSGPLPEGATGLHRVRVHVRG